MSNRESSVVILDTQNNYENSLLQNEEINIIDIEKDHSHCLDMIKKTRPDMLAKVINEDDYYTFEDIINFLQKVRQLSEDTQLLVVNVENERDKIYQLISIGVNGVCDGKTTTLIDALKHMQEYHVYISYSYQRALVEEFQHKPQPSKNVTLRINAEKAREELTTREIEILEDLVLFEGNYEERAKRLFISPKTLKNHMIRIMDKLYADNRTHIIPIAIKKGIIETVSASKLH